jgi:hypothetical protein
MIDFGKAKRFPAEEHYTRWNNYGKYCMDWVDEDGLWLEFGVASGATSIEIIKNLRKSDDVLYGFDWFKGLPEDWIHHKSGAMFGQKEYGVPPVVDRLEIVNGLFEDTLPTFVKNDFEIAFMHVDCDLYSSTKTIFKHVKPKLKRGTIIMFDEYHNYDGFKDHEFKAWNEFVEETKLKYEWIAYTDGEEACCMITEISQ